MGLCRTPQCLSCGVPHGSVLGPFFILFILHLKQTIQQFKILQYQLYADDIQFYSSFKGSEFQKSMSSANLMANTKHWLSDSYLQLNTDKTETLIIVPENNIFQTKQFFIVLGSSV